MNSLRVENISLALDEPILTDVSLELIPGECLTLLGPSGSGKTSLLRCLNRLETPGKGRILLGGHDLRSIPPAELRSQVGMVFQTPGLVSGTAIDNVTIGPGLRDRVIEKDKIEDLLKQLELPEVLWKRDVNTLSVGERQRIALAQTLANRPEVLLLDEPTSAFDPALVKKIEKLIQSISKNSGVSIILVTHNIEQARRFNALTLVLLEGKIVARGCLDKIMNSGNPALQAYFSREKKI